jgi:hypothetical protein
MDRWVSGLNQYPAKVPTLRGPWVRIPPCPLCPRRSMDRTSAYEAADGSSNLSEGATKTRGDSHGAGSYFLAVREEIELKKDLESIDFIESFNVKHIFSDASNFLYKDKLIVDVKVDDAKYVTHVLVEGTTIHDMFKEYPCRYCSITINLL